MWAYAGSNVRAILSHGNVRRGFVKNCSKRQFKVRILKQTTSNSRQSYHASIRNHWHQLHRCQNDFIRWFLAVAKGLIERAVFFRIALEKSSSLCCVTQSTLDVIALDDHPDWRHLFGLGQALLTSSWRHCVNSFPACRIISTSRQSFVCISQIIWRRVLPKKPLNFRKFRMW